MGEKKICKSCFEEMDSRAKKCPHCLELQSGFFLLGGKIALVLAIIVMVIVGWQLVSLAFRKPHKLPAFAEPVPSSDYKNQVKAVDPRMAFDETGSCPQVLVYFTAVNHGKSKLRSLQYSVEFADANDAVFDLDTDTQVFTVIDANSTLPIKLSFRQDFVKERYKGVRVQVTNAESAREY